MIRGPGALRSGGVNYARRQHSRRLLRAARLGLTSAAAGGLGLLAVTAGAALLGALLVLLAVMLGLRARHWLSLAARSRVGARTEDEVRRALDSLEGQCWRLRHGLRWSGPGDIDSVAVAPNGLGFAIETKTWTYDERHLRRVLEQARWLRRRRRRWCRRGALAVLCVVRAARLERSERGVLVVSIDRLVPALSEAANAAERGPRTPLAGRLVV